ncbi:hypothetical protein [Mycolicibacterium fortuitum]|uniref:hypothetical protein n=1 Tax=Mycolicibacterium fortuitum TaxID=1766 RepID=UPI001CE05E91|nr:hypothetical protein [Mycolicibacterium fortuitum]
MGALSGLTDLRDAQIVEGTIVDAAVAADDPVAALRFRAAAVRVGCQPCANPEGLAQSLEGAATVLDVM